MSSEIEETLTVLSAAGMVSSSSCDGGGLVGGGELPDVEVSLELLLLFAITIGTRFQL
jgi:hypothetical protein